MFMKIRLKFGTMENKEIVFSMERIISEELINIGELAYVAFETTDGNFDFNLSPGLLFAKIRRYEKEFFAYSTRA
ncbi:hypothetical protein RCL_jg1373.t1 [Rhizophagus clarus]|uniref:Uncharacterized protein n=1 Tax=Rhizophagus clarus TaxID=94130 RepID=A0A8H3QUD2_9GLOM|nr:hypothetical protein RCL_jg1373.t1 [Rhizophagus clarus]